MEQLNHGKEVKQAYKNKLKNKLYGVLREYEKNRQWDKFLDSILIDLMGYSEEEKTINYYILWHKLTSLKYLNYAYFRTTIFDCMELIGN